MKESSNSVPLEQLLLQTVRLPLLTAMALVAVLVVGYLSVSEVLSLRSDLHAKSEFLRFNAVVALAAGDDAYLDRLLASVVHGADASAAGIRTASGQWVHTENASLSNPWEQSNWQKAFSFKDRETSEEAYFYGFDSVAIHTTIESQPGKSMGEVYIVLSTRNLRESVLQILVLIGVSLLVSTAGAVFFAQWKARTLAGGVQAFVDVVRHISVGDDRKARVYPVVGSSGEQVIQEIANLALEFDSMLDQIELKEASLETAVLDRTAELEKSREKAAESARMAALGEMAGGIAHEINNPLAIIKASAEQLMKVAESPAIPQDAVNRLAERINRVSDRIAKIVTGLRTFAREGKGDPIEHTDLVRVVSETLEFCVSRFKENGIEVSIHPLPEDFFVNGRPVQISQVLLNLLNNAHDALRAGEADDSRIEIFGWKKGEWIELHVVDNGPGISDAVRDRIMQPFFTTKEVGKGTGLGLSISLSIMEDHKGSLTLDSSAKPTRFIMRFPHADSGLGPVIDELALKVA